MLSCFSRDKKIKAIPIAIVAQKDFPNWLRQQSGAVKNWLKSTQFRHDVGFGDVRLIPDTQGEIERVLCCVLNPEDMWCVGNLPLGLPEGVYEFENDHDLYPIAWGSGAYQFARYKKMLREPACLKLANLPATNYAEIENIISAIYLARDLINTPTDDMGPSEMSAEVKKLAKKYTAHFKEIVGEDLLTQNYAAIYTVGRASDDAPRLLEVRWGNPKHPKVTLVGKGVCFDSGGLDIKSAPYMALMKKDMGGAAYVLALGEMIMRAELKVALRILIPCVENVISGNAYRPGDVIKSREGLTIEIGNTDAEGRLILADALTEGASDNPELLIDVATLTGAARVALGPDLPALFSNDDKLATEVIRVSEDVQDAMWQMPLYTPYREYLYSQIADINNNSSEPYAGAITAALFLQDFVPDDVPWMHFDVMAWNIRPRPGRVPGAEALTLRALFAYLKTRYAKNR